MLYKSEQRDSEVDELYSILDDEVVYERVETRMKMN